MNINYPHDIEDFKDIPESVRKRYVPLEQQEAEALAQKTADERAAWLKERMASIEERFRRASRSDKL